MWEKIKDNIAALIAVGVFAWIAGNVQGTNQTSQIARDVSEIKTGIVDLKAGEKLHDDFQNCAKIKFALIERGQKPSPDECEKGN
jgi:hypothetical protein